MALEYTNRRGDKYFVLQGKTKTGKPKYYCSKRSAGVGVDQLPDGYEIHERPENGLVSVRKTRPTRIQPFERELLVGLARELAHSATIVEIERDALVVYSSDVSPAESIRFLGVLVGDMSPAAQKGHADWMVRHARYSPTLRFALTDEDERLYSAERWCYRGGREHWIPLRGNLTLESVARKLLPHVGEESFFELF
ncbi:MAG: hypothetical protein KY475_21295 [Planctomycetes bacterium]|nr:hypothetical protein [Planctomycetota bacterium]